MPKRQSLSLGPLTLLSGHPVLDQVARDLIAGVKPENLPAQKMTLYVGLHRKFGLRLLRPGKRIALQTEHYYDADGRPMWRKMKRWRTLVAVLLCHRVLDLSPCNRPHYAFLPRFLQKKVIFGPHIFPCSQPEFQPGQTGEFLFFGELSARRREILAAQPPGKAEILPPGTFGEALQQRISGAAGILNLHYSEGRYSEMPRLLSALLAGKVVMSEPLGDELTHGRDYLPLGDYVPEEKRREVYDSFWQNFASRHQLSALLSRIAG